MNSARLTLADDKGKTLPKIKKAKGGKKIEKQASARMTMADIGSKSKVVEKKVEKKKRSILSGVKLPSLKKKTKKNTVLPV